MPLMSRQGMRRRWHESFVSPLAKPGMTSWSRFVMPVTMSGWSGYTEWDRPSESRTERSLARARLNRLVAKPRTATATRLITA